MRVIHGMGWSHTGGDWDQKWCSKGWVGKRVNHESTVKFSKFLKRMQTAKVAVQKKAGEFFHPIWRALGTTTFAGEVGSVDGMDQTKLNCWPTLTIILQNPSLRSSLANHITQVGSVSNMKKRTARKTSPRSFTADWSSAGTVVSLTEGWEGSREEALGCLYRREEALTGAERLRMIRSLRLCCGTTATRDTLRLGGAKESRSDSSMTSAKPAST